jgi:hypothetical protein
MKPVPWAVVYEGVLVAGAPHDMRWTVSAPAAAAGKRPGSGTAVRVAPCPPAARSLPERRSIAPAAAAGKARPSAWMSRLSIDPLRAL